MRVFACMASSLDGKIGPANTDRFVAIGSRYDMENLISLRDEADGILFGASTFRTWPKIHRGNNPSRNPHQFVMSRSLNLDFSSELFQNQLVPVTIFTSSEDSLEDGIVPDHARIINVPEGKGQVKAILEHMALSGVESLLIEGGGQILNQFFGAAAVQELYLTLVPVVIGGANAPALLGGVALSSRPRIKVLETRQVEQEVFLHLEFVYE